MPDTPLATLGWDSARHAELEAQAPGARPGRVVTADRGLACCLTEEGPVAAALAAGVDIVAVVEPLWPDPEIGRIERLLVLAWESGAQPVVLLTKADLVPDADLVTEDVARIAPGADVVSVSTVSRVGMAAVRELARPGRTLALVGPSGSGKSTLVNALAGAPLLAVAEVRRDGKGRHTSVRRELVLLPGGGVVIDTPGLRGVGLTGDVGTGLATAFDDVGELAASCRFSDCRHETEPGCAVLSAVETGELPVRRLESWRKLQREARWAATRTDARLRAAERSVWRRRTRERRATPYREDPRRR